MRQNVGGSPRTFEEASEMATKRSPGSKSRQGHSQGAARKAAQAARGSVKFKSGSGTHGDGMKNRNPKR